MRTIAQRELVHPKRILDEVEQGEEFVVTRNGRPVARILPVDMTPLERRAQMLRSGQIAEPATESPRDYVMRRIEVEATSWDELVDWMRG